MEIPQNKPHFAGQGIIDPRLDQLMFVYKSLDIIYLFPLFCF